MLPPLADFRNFRKKSLGLAAIVVLEPLKKVANNFDELKQSIDRNSAWLSNLL